ncbi:GNAT family N-acetyltransferase [Clavibacter sp. CT19]|uniref:GNAT family N-acetyltransferase n=1 Tax=unclassified Clavibacter TaxID=2626594 RepID=UPI0022EAC46A|nr:GNAT family N-acetyltransferase [Clavibacter sp. CT19]MDA3805063.1 GNAT family N-acetyltransferase [Clavibacter sp. CT19]
MVDLAGDMVIETPRLRLRRPRAADVDAVHAYRSRPDVARHLGAGTWTREKTAAELALYAASAFSRPDDELVLLVELLATGVVVGEVGLVRREQGAEVGYVFHPDHGGRGLATEAVSAVVTAALADGSPRIIARTDAANRSSRALCERLGFTLIATAVSEDGRGVAECTYERAASHHGGADGTP